MKVNETLSIMKKSILLLFAIFLMIYGALAQANCKAPVITQVSGAGTYCPGTQVTLEVTGTLNDANTWTWYSDACGGSVVGTGKSIKVEVNKTTIYFVRGTGGCVGTTATCTSLQVKKDDIGPEIISAPQDTVIANTEGECGANVFFEPPKGKDSCSDIVYVKRVAGLDPGSFFPVGTTEVKYELRDTIGNTTLYSFMVTVEDKELPIIECAKDTLVHNEPGKCGAIVTYEVPVGTDNCPDAVTKRISGLGSGAFFPVGVTKEIYTVTDASGNVDSCSFIVTVKDVEPPMIHVNQIETVLWPPDHKHQTIVIADYIESVSDNCGGISIDDVIIDEVGSDEPNNGKGDGNTLDDILISSNCDTTQLLAERSGTGNGRVYVVTLAVMDLHGNIGTALFTVEVPHDKGKGKKSNTTLDNIIYVENGCDLLFEEDTLIVSPTTASATQPALAETRNEGRPSVFPNPFDNSFSITFAANANDYVKVELYNLMGMKVMELFQQSVEAGRLYTWTIENSALNPNEYLLVISGAKTRQAIRLIQKR